MYIVYDDFGWTYGRHETLKESIIAARKAVRKTGLICCIFHIDNPFKVVKWVFPRRRNG